MVADLQTRPRTRHFFLLGGILSRLKTKKLGIRKVSLQLSNGGAKLALTTATGSILRLGQSNSDARSSLGEHHPCRHWHGVGLEERKCQRLSMLMERCQQEMEFPVSAADRSPVMGFRTATLGADPAARCPARISSHCDRNACHGHNQNLLLTIQNACTTVGSACGAGRLVSA